MCLLGRVPQTCLELIREAGRSCCSDEVECPLTTNITSIVTIIVMCLIISSQFVCMNIDIMYIFVFLLVLVLVLLLPLLSTPPSPPLRDGRNLSAREART